MKLVECVPNFSEGRRPEVVAAIREAIAGVQGVAVLDVSSDASHNRSVITFVSPAAAAADAAFAGIKTARDLIDLNVHEGEHPRIGAADVVPFVPLEGSTMEDCIALARQLGERVGRELEIPVFLYERAATRADRTNLANIRRGEFEAAKAEIGVRPERTPDFGPNRAHPTAGAVVIGARPFLVAYNVYLGPATNLSVAKEVAKAVRGSSGGLANVKALGLEVDGQAQVSMNLVDTERTPLHSAYELVSLEAEARGVTPTWSEIVGLVPERVLFEAAARHVRLRGFTPEIVLERQVRRQVAGGESLAGFVASVAGPAPTPGGGSVAALAGQLGAALAQMVAGLTTGKKKYADVEAEMRDAAVRAADLGNRLAALVARDAAAYDRVAAAYKLPKEPESEAAARATAVRKALFDAAHVPLETARLAAEVADLAARMASVGNRNAVTDAGVAALLAEAACRGAAWNVRVNVSALDDRGGDEGRALVSEARRLVQAAQRDSGAAQAAVEKVLQG